MNSAGPKEVRWRGGAPLVAGKIHGLRSWEIDFAGGELRLMALHTAGVWEPGGAPTEARCEETWGRDHDAPGKFCGCGLYALHPSAESAEQLLHMAVPGTLKVLGIVEAWGRTEVHESGFRAQFARPVSLVVHPEYRETDLGKLIARVARRYEAELLVAGNPEEVARHCQTRGLGVSPAVTKELLAGADAEPAERSDDPPPDKKTLRDRATWVVTMVLGLFVSLIYAAFWGALGIGLLGAILGWFDGDGSRSATAMARPHLRVMDQAVLGAASRKPAYVAVVRNDARGRAALDVTPRLRVQGAPTIARLARSGEFDHPADVPPGGTALAIDRLPVIPAGRLASPRLHVGAFRRTAAFPIERLNAMIDGEACAMSAEVVASRPIKELTLFGLSRKGGRIVGGGGFELGPVQRGRSTHRLPDADVQCGRRAPRWSLYPALTPSHGQWRN